MLIGMPADINLSDRHSVAVFVEWRGIAVIPEGHPGGARIGRGLESDAIRHIICHVTTNTQPNGIAESFPIKSAWIISRGVVHAAVLVAQAEIAVQPDILHRRGELPFGGRRGCGSVGL